MATWQQLTTDRLRGRSVVRDPNESHRASTPLELFFDLTFVVAVSRAAAALHHQLVEGHIGAGVIGFLAAFFGIWWAWMNFTWFASAHDSDDVTYRLLTLVQMAGALVFAAGVGRAVDDREFLVATIGYAIMRIGLVLSWLRVARDSPAVRRRALRFASGITIIQLLWILRLALPGELTMWSFLLLAIGEISIPVWAERAVAEPIFHPEHIEERYGLFTIIMLGESILSASVGFESAADETGLTAELLAVALSALVLAFSAWWLYFDHPGHLTPSPAQGFRWGYGHVLVFASLAAAGAGFQVAADALSGHGSVRTAALAMAIPAAGFLLGLVVVMLITGTRVTELRIWPKIVAAVAMIAAGLVASVPVTAILCAALMLVLVVWMVLVEPPPQRHA